MKAVDRAGVYRRRWRVQKELYDCRLSEILVDNTVPVGDLGWIQAMITGAHQGANLMGGRYVAFRLAEVAVPQALFAEIPRRINRLRGRS